MREIVEEGDFVIDWPLLLVSFGIGSRMSIEDASLCPRGWSVDSVGSCWTATYDRLVLIPTKNACSLLVEFLRSGSEYVRIFSRFAVFLLYDLLATYVP
jgi:hypothetical protein